LPIETVSQGMPGREGSRCLTRQEQVASYSRALVVTAATATTLKAAVLLRRMSLSRSRVFFSGVDFYFFLNRISP